MRAMYSEVLSRSRFMKSDNHNIGQQVPDINSLEEFPPLSCGSDHSPMTFQADSLVATQSAICPASVPLKTDVGKADRGHARISLQPALKSPSHLSHNSSKMSRPTTRSVPRRKKSVVVVSGVTYFTANRFAVLADLSESTNTRTSPVSPLPSPSGKSKKPKARLSAFNGRSKSAIAIDLASPPVVHTAKTSFQKIKSVSKPSSSVCPLPSKVECPNRLENKPMSSFEMAVSDVREEKAPFEVFPTKSVCTSVQQPCKVGTTKRGDSSVNQSSSYINAQFETQCPFFQMDFISPPYPYEGFQLQDSWKANYQQFPVNVASLKSLDIFYSKNKEPILSNMYNSQMSFPSLKLLTLIPPSVFIPSKFSSVEAGYQFVKAVVYNNHELATLIANSTGMEAKRLSKALSKCKHKNTIAFWNKIKCRIMWMLLWDKVYCCPEFAERLLQTYPHPLTHNVSDSFWGHMFSNLIMQIRLVLIHDSSNWINPGHNCSTVKKDHHLSVSDLHSLGHSPTVHPVSTTKQVKPLSNHIISHNSSVDISNSFTPLSISEFSLPSHHHSSKSTRISRHKFESSLLRVQVNRYGHYSAPSIVDSFCSNRFECLSTDNEIDDDNIEYDDNVANYEYKINFCGRIFPYISNKTRLTNKQVLKFLKQKVKVKENISVKCNGTSNHRFILPSDNIVCITGLMGGARSKDAKTYKDIHPNKICDKCFVCKKSGTRFIHLIQRKENDRFVTFVQQLHPTLDECSCICRACEAHLLRLSVKEESNYVT